MKPGAVTLATLTVARERLASLEADHPDRRGLALTVSEVAEAFTNRTYAKREREQLDELLTATHDLRSELERQRRDRGEGGTRWELTRASA